jgi:AraC family transcriptional regulator
MRKILSEHRCLGLLMQRASYRCRADVEIACEDYAVTLKYVPGHCPVNARIRRGDDGENAVGALSLTPAGMQVAARPMRDETDLPAFIFHLDPDWLAREWRSAFSHHPAPIPHNANVRDDAIEKTLARLSCELRQPGLASDAMVESLVRILSIDLARYVQAQTMASASCGPELSRGRLEQIQHFVLNFSVGTPSLSEIAAECALSPSHLRRLFKQGTGLTLQEYVEKVRIEKARALLSGCDLPLKVISHRLGYSHPSGFSVAFKRATGETPQSYRQRSGASPATRFVSRGEPDAYPHAAPLVH